MKILFSFILLLQLLGCKKETNNCNCPTEPLGYFYFGLRTLFYPINNTVIPLYVSNDDTNSFHLYLRHRFFVDNPPPLTGLDYYRYETDMTEFRCEKFGLFYYSTAGGELTQTLSQLNIDWFGVQGIDTVFQKYSIAFNLPVDSNKITTSTVIYDSLVVNNKWYRKVLTGPVVKSHQPGLDYFGPVPKQYYYSTEYGIIKLDMSDGTFWEIISD